jgi:hypothetical protein
MLPVVTAVKAVVFQKQDIVNVLEVAEEDAT